MDIWLMFVDFGAFLGLCLCLCGRFGGPFVRWLNE